MVQSGSPVKWVAVVGLGRHYCSVGLVAEQLQTFEERLELQPGYVWSTGYFQHGPVPSTSCQAVPCLSHLRTPGQGGFMDMNESMNFTCRH